MQVVAFKDLIEKQQNGKKGKLIFYETLQISDYLLPKSNISVQDKLELFSYRAQMNNLSKKIEKTTSASMGALKPWTTVTCWSAHFSVSTVCLISNYLMEILMKKCMFYE